MNQMFTTGWAALQGGRTWHYYREGLTLCAGNLHWPEMHTPCQVELPSQGERCRKCEKHLTEKDHAENPSTRRIN